MVHDADEPVAGAVEPFDARAATRCAAPRASRCPRTPHCTSTSARSGVAASAAADGVGARKSATRSHSVTSGLVADRRNHRHRHRRDGARHPLAVERPEVLDRAAAPSDDQHVDRQPASAVQRASTPTASALAPGPAPARRSARQCGQRRATTDWMSRSTAPSGLVMTAMRRGNGGSRRLRAGSSSPSLAQRGLGLLERELPQAVLGRSTAAPMTVSWNSPFSS